MRCVWCYNRRRVCHRDRRWRKKPNDQKTDAKLIKNAAWHVSPPYGSLENSDPIVNIPHGLYARPPLPAAMVRWGIGYYGHGPHPVRASKMGEKMDVQTLIIWLIVGAIAGWLAGMVVKGGGYGLIGDIIVGIVGGLIAGWLLPQIGIVIGGGFIAAIINAFIGAVILLIVLRLIKRAA